MAEWNVSAEAARLHKDAHVWDMMLPWGYQDNSENKHGTVEGAASTVHLGVSHGVGRLARVRRRDKGHRR